MLPSRTRIASATPISAPRRRSSGACDGVKCRWAGRPSCSTRRGTAPVSAISEPISLDEIEDMAKTLSKVPHGRQFLAVAGSGAADAAFVEERDERFLVGEDVAVVGVDEKRQFFEGEGIVMIYLHLTPDIRIHSLS